MNGHTHFLTGLIGRGILRSASPSLHEQEADEHGVRLIYMLYDFESLALDTADIPAVLESAARLGFSGLNVTHPYKQAVIPYLDELSESAQEIGAVNTISFRDGRTVGHNTDSLGFAESMRRGLPAASMKRVVLLGTGGAGAAVSNALMQLGVQRLVLHDKDIQRAEDLAATLSATYGSSRVEVTDNVNGSIRAADGLVNATPIGMTGYSGMPVTNLQLNSQQWVADIIYVPLETELLKTARALGCRAINGTGMVVFQAAAAFDIFTGLHADGERMLTKFRNSIGG